MSSSCRSAPRTDGITRRRWPILFALVSAHQQVANVRGTSPMERVVSEPLPAKLALVKETSASSLRNFAPLALFHLMAMATLSVRSPRRIERVQSGHR